MILKYMTECYLWNFLGVEEWVFLLLLVQIIIVYKLLLFRSNFKAAYVTDYVFK